MTDRNEALRLADELMEVHHGHADEGPSSFSEAAAELRRLSAEVEALRADAGRYRWLSSRLLGPLPMVRVQIMKRGQYSIHTDLNAAIDAAAKDKP